MVNEYYAGMMQHTVVTNITKTMLPFLETEYSFINMIISVGMMSFISYIMSRINSKLFTKRIFYFFSNYFDIIKIYCSRKIELEFLAKNCGSYYDYSELLEVLLYSIALGFKYEMMAAPVGVTRSPI